MRCNQFPHSKSLIKVPPTCILHLFLQEHWPAAIPADHGSLERSPITRLVCSTSRHGRRLRDPGLLKAGCSSSSEDMDRCYCKGFILCSDKADFDHHII